MTPDEMKAREIVNKIPLSCYSNNKDDIAKDIIKSLSSVRQAEREKLIEQIKSIDPLEAICHWEDGDEIARAVQGLIIKTLKEQEGV